jgi:NADPH:quinone reductase-like Zn-dependent oxidoreductase
MDTERVSEKARLDGARAGDEPTEKLIARVNALEALDDVRALRPFWPEPISAESRATPHHVRGTMQSWWMQMTHTEATLELRETPVPQLGPTQLLVHMRAAALNRGELMPGHGTVGECEGYWRRRRGRGRRRWRASHRLQAGDRVMGRCSGAFSEYALIDEAEGHGCAACAFVGRGGKHSPDFSWRTTLVLQGRLRSGEWLLINGVVVRRRCGVAAAGEIPGRARHRHFGLRSQAGGPRAARARRRVVHALADFAPAVMEATGQRGADLVVNAVGGSGFAENIRALAFEGRLATVGYVDGVLHADLDLARLHAKRLTLFGVSNKLRSKEQRAAAVPRFVAEVMPHFAAGRIKPQIDQVSTLRSLRMRRRAWRPDAMSERSSCACPHLTVLRKSRP